MSGEKLLFWVESLEFLQEDIVLCDSVVLVGHHQELQDGTSAGTEEHNRSVSVRSCLRVHHDLVQLVPGKTNTALLLFGQMVVGFLEVTPHWCGYKMQTLTADIQAIFIDDTHRWVYYSTAGEKKPCCAWCLLFHIHPMPVIPG